MDIFRLPLPLELLSQLGGDSVVEFMNDQVHGWEEHGQLAASRLINIDKYHVLDVFLCIFYVHLCNSTINPNLGNYPITYCVLVMCLKICVLLD